MNKFTALLLSWLCASISRNIIRRNWIWYCRGHFVFFPLLAPFIHLNSPAYSCKYQVKFHCRAQEPGTLYNPISRKLLLSGPLQEKTLYMYMQSTPDTSVKQTLRDGPSLSLLPLFDSLSDGHLSKTDTYSRSPRCPSQKELTVHAVKPCFTDTRLIQTPRYYRRFSILFPWEESPYIFSKFNLLNIDTPVNPDNGHLFLAPINLTNANTSSSSFCCNRSCLSECKIILQFTAFQCSQCYNTPDRMICSCQFETILASFKLCREWFGLTL